MPDSHKLGHSPETFAAWMGYSTAPTILSYLAPSEYHLFGYLHNSLNGVNVDTVEDIKNYLFQFFAIWEMIFYERGILKLREKWLKVMEKSEQYIIK